MNKDKIIRVITVTPVVTIKGEIQNTWENET